MNKARLSRNDLVLDVGSGTGVLEQRLEGAIVVGIDLTREMLTIAKSKKIESMKIMILGDAERLPFVEGIFDRVLSCYAVKYCNSKKFADQCFRTLKPGGRIVLYDFARPHGLTYPFHFFYVYGVLRLFGLLAGKFDRGLSYTLMELPKIIRRTRWEEELWESLAEKGFENISSFRMSAGAARIFSADKPS